MDKVVFGGLMTRRFGFGLIVLTLFGCGAEANKQSRSSASSAASQTAPTAAADSAGVADLYKKLLTVGPAGDADAYAALFVDGGAVLLPNEPAPDGPGEMQAWARRFFGAWKVQIDTFTMVDQRVGSTVGFSRYRVVGKYLPKAGGQPVPFDQKYVDTFVKESTGDWRFAVHMVNSNTKGKSIFDAAGIDKPTNRRVATSSASSAADSAGVAALYDQLRTIGGRGDPDEYAGMFAEGGTVLAPNAPAPVGRAELREWAKRFFERWRTEVDTFTVMDRRIGSTVGFTRYRATGRYMPRDGKGQPVPFDQKYVDTYVKDAAGNWKFAVHMFNANKKMKTVWD
jgi:ketosteroid isomerase-like protein